MKNFWKSIFAIALVATICLSNASDAMAARTGGRIGGGSFGAPSRNYSSPRGGYSSPGGYGYGYGYGGGGGIGFPFLLPFFGFGGGFGGLFTILIFIAIANFLVKSVRNIAGGDEGEIVSYDNPKVSVGQVQVGLLSSARDLQSELDELAMRADTATPSGRATVLQETTLALLRHPEYWVYGATQSQQTALNSAEAKFNQLALAERSKFTEETLTNVNSQLKNLLQGSELEKGGELVAQTERESGEYIMVTVIVGIDGKLELPTINNTEDLHKALQQIGSIGSDRLLAVEILWTPQAQGDTLTKDDILAQYPNVKLV
ncbi:MAG: DUF1517 domain-containing protein [Xenococcaceae cyanobacterium]